MFELLDHTALISLRRVPNRVGIRGSSNVVMQLAMRQAGGRKKAWQGEGIYHASIDRQVGFTPCACLLENAVTKGLVAVPDQPALLSQFQEFQGHR